MLKRFASESEFVRNVLTLTSGTALAQLIPFFLAPFLSRIYNPEEFGRLALYLSIVNVLGVICSGRYELAIMLPKKNKEGVQLTLLSIVITIFVSIVILIIVLFFADSIALALGDPKLAEWLYLVPISIVLIGFFNALNYFNTREKKFKNIATANIYKSFGGNITQLILGLAKYTSGGLIIGHAMSHLFGNIRMAKTFLKYKEEIKTTTKSDLKQLAKRYIDFPKFSMWGIFLNSLSLNSTNIFVSWFYSVAALGQYAHGYKYLTLPITLIGRSIGQVYFQKLAIERGDSKAMKKVFVTILKKIVWVALVIFIPLYFVVEWIFPIFFGENWVTAGKYAKILVPLMGVRFVVSTLSISLTVLEKQRKELLVHIVILISTLLSWGISYFYKLPIEMAIKLYVFSLSLVYIFILAYIYRIFDKEETKLTS